MHWQWIELRNVYSYLYMRYSRPLDIPALAWGFLACLVPRA